MFTLLSSSDWTTASHSWQVCLYVPSDPWNYSKMQLNKCFHSPLKIPHTISVLHSSPRFPVTAWADLKHWYFFLKSQQQTSFHLPEHLWNPVLYHIPFNHTTTLKWNPLHHFTSTSWHPGGEMNFWWSTKLQVSGCLQTKTKALPLHQVVEIKILSVVWLFILFYPLLTGF